MAYTPNPPCKRGTERAESVPVTARAARKATPRVFSDSTARLCVIPLTAWPFDRTFAPRTSVVTPEGVAVLPPCCRVPGRGIWWDVLEDARRTLSTRGTALVVRLRRGRTGIQSLTAPSHPPPHRSTTWATGFATWGHADRALSLDHRTKGIGAARHGSHLAGLKAGPEASWQRERSRAAGIQPEVICLPRRLIAAASRGLNCPPARY